MTRSRTTTVGLCLGVGAHHRQPAQAQTRVSLIPVGQAVDAKAIHDGVLDGRGGRFVIARQRHEQQAGVVPLGRFGQAPEKLHRVRIRERV